MGIPDHLTCLLRNLQVKKQQLEPDMEQWTGSKLGKEYVKAVYCHHACLTYIQSTSWEMPDWMKHKLESRLLGEISITSDMQVTPPLRQKQREIKEPLDESERGEWKAGLELNIQKTKYHGILSHHFMANRWGNNGNSDRLYLFFCSPKFTAGGDCSHEIKKCLPLGRKVTANLDSILKSRDITLPRKVWIVKSMVFQYSWWELDHKESSAPKNWCFWIVVLEKTLESPMDCKESKSVHPKGNQSWIFIERTDAEAVILWPPDGKERTR